MVLLQCDINSVRNLTSVSLALSPDFNVFYGQNGSGKTSVLESLYLLSHNRSFRHHSIQPVIHHESQALSVFSRLKQRDLTQFLGIEKTREGKTTLRLDGETISSAAVLAELLPLQLIHPDSDELLTGSPSLRRQFLDWGVFHVEHSFLGVWQRWQRILKQRNAALKTGLSRDQVCGWDEEYIKTCEMMAVFRQDYLEKLAVQFQSIIKDFLPEFQLELVYHRGWPKDSLLVELLERHYFRDVQLKHTHYGPHRDDVIIQCGENKASEMLSRGEQKLVVIALRLAQGQLLKELMDKTCLYLLDDFAAELDANHRLCVIERLASFKSQVFLTTIDYNEVKSCINFTLPKLFHVEHGAIKEV
ncbi:MAG TPA: DNA replication/repair protein RecF [Gammaproteobacteria bacterium]|nr:DNA replication/repair protein RecF [Gammaproteobacteria bacterium]